MQSGCVSASWRIAHLLPIAFPAGWLLAVMTHRVITHLSPLYSLLFTIFAQTLQNMITTDQIKDLVERRDALRRYL